MVADLAGLVLLSLRSRRSVEAEDLFLRRQLALFQERGVTPMRVDVATRLSLALLSRFFDWRDALVVVRPETLIRWHRAGWRLFWRVKSRPGRPPIPLELRQLIRRIASENPLWGEERIANELLLKLGLRFSPRTVRKYMPKRPPGHPRGDQRWSTSLHNHARAVVACDFFVAVTATFRLFYVFVVIEHGSRRLMRVAVTAHPSAAWALQQLREVAGCDRAHQYLIHDWDSILRHYQPAIYSASASGCTPDRCWVACITSISCRPRWRDRINAEHRSSRAFILPAPTTTSTAASLDLRRSGYCVAGLGNAVGPDLGHLEARDLLLRRVVSRFAGARRDG